MSLYLGENLISGVANPIEPTRNIGQIVTSTIPLSDAGLHLLDGAVISGDGIYSDFVDFIKNLHQQDPNGSWITDETGWQNSVNTYGVCGKFAIDYPNNTVRLPKLYANERYLIKSYSSGTSWYRIYSDGWCEQGGYQSTPIDNFSTFISFILPFTNTDYSIVLTQSRTNSGNWSTVPPLLSYSKVTNGVNTQCQGSEYLTWRASGYVNISDYAVSQQYNYIVIATSTKTQIEVDIDQIATDLNGKADVDLSNCTKPHIVETYVNGESWYRLWSDGWCEQGGGSVTSSGNVYFPKAFRDTNYCLLGSIGHGNRSDTWEHYNMEKTAANYFHQECCFDYYHLVSWYACGYVS